jgi:hypothetical protein
MAAKVNFHSRRKPAQLKTVCLTEEESGFGKIHFPGHILHPLLIHRLGKDTDGRRISGKRFGRKGIYLKDRHVHGFFFYWKICINLAF